MTVIFYPDAVRGHLARARFKRKDRSKILLRACFLHRFGIWTVDSVMHLVGPVTVRVSGVTIENVLVIIWPLGLILAHRVPIAVEDDRDVNYWSFSLPWLIETEAVV